MEEKQDNKKAMRTANIRISAINNTKSGLISYTKEGLELVLKSWEKDKQLDYFLIEHDEDIKNIHFHMVLKFKTTTTFQTIKNKFPYGDIQSSKSTKNSIQYLVHMNSPEKHKYDWEDIITNSSELNRYMLKSKVSEELDIKHYISEIDKGNIKEFEYTKKIPIEIYTKYSSRIDKAFKFFYDNYSLNADREIEVEFLCGAGGSGKTSFAKNMAELHDSSYCISSSSNDPMQDYKGQDILILDDLRDESFRFDDLLKILDNHTGSSISSRYKNKTFIGKRIVITSTIELKDWYSWESYEDKHQLKRRIATMIKFNDNDIVFYEYNEETKGYEYQAQIENCFKRVKSIERESKIQKRYGFLINSLR